jgi:multidrug transporter EmrE-like cation transporter
MLLRFLAPHTFTLLVLGSALCFTTGGIFMKLSEGLTRPGATALLFILFIAGACLQTLAMRGEDLGVTYIVVLGVEAILAFIFGWLLFNEQVSPLKIAGILAILAGIVALRH